MGLPSVIIEFKEQGITAIQRGQRGIVALILRDEPESGTLSVTQIITSTDIPKGLADKNKEQIQLALKGYQTPPKKVIACVIPDDADYDETLLYLETVRFDYLAVPEVKDNEAEELAGWIKQQRDTKGKKVKAVLPNVPADHEGIINFTTDEIVTGSKTYTTAEYCARMAGLFAGTPMTISATFAPLPEVVSCTALTREEMDKAIDKGQLIIFNDGEKVKVARAVNSFITTIADKGVSYKKIKLIDAMDMINDDISKTAQDSYLGKYPNSYDNKCLLIQAIQGYFDQLELNGILDKDKNNASLDVDTQRVYLKSTGVDVENMKDQDIKEANTKDQVFLAADIKILDAIEDIRLKITI